MKDFTSIEDVLNNITLEDIDDFIVAMPSVAYVYYNKYIDCGDDLCEIMEYAYKKYIRDVWKDEAKEAYDKGELVNFYGYEFQKEVV